MAEPPGLPVPDGIGYLAYRLHCAVSHEVHRRLAPRGLLPAEWNVLRHLARGVETPARLADCMEVDRGAVSRLLGRLERGGYLRRQPHPRDKRSTVVALTTTGQARAAELDAAIRAVSRDLLSYLSPDDADRLASLLRAVAERLPAKAHAAGKCPLE